MWSRQIVASLDAYRDLRDAAGEAAFYAFYGSPLVQAMLGLCASEAPPRPRPGHEPEELALIREQTEALRARRIAAAMNGAVIFEKPDGSPRLRRVMRVDPSPTGCHE